MSLKDIISRQQGGGHSNQASAIVQSLSTALASSGKANFGSQRATGYALGLESFVDDKAALADTETAVSSLSQAIAALEGIAPDLTAAQKSAAITAGVISGDMRTFLGNVSEESKMANGSVGRLSAALESFDEKENKAASVYTVAYNLMAARQDDFGEAFFPTVVVSPEQAGYHVHINLVNLIDSTRRKTTGEIDNWGRVNLVHVLRNPDLIHSDSTNIVPVYSDTSKHNFVDEAIVKPSVEPYGNTSVTTSWLAVGKKFDLLALSQTDALLNNQTLDETDSIDTDIRLDALLLKVGADVIAMSTKAIPGNVFHYNVQGDKQEMILRIQSDSLNVNPSTVQAGDVKDLVELAPVVAGKWTVQLDVHVNGSVFRDKGITRLSADPVTVARLLDEDGTVHLPTSPAAAAIVALFADAQIIGYKLKTRRTNLNRRSIGQMLETRQETQVYGVPLLPPFTMRRPLGLSDTTDASDLASLVTLTHAAASGAAVNTLLQAAKDLKELTAGKRPLTSGLMVMGLARHLLTAYYKYVPLDVSDLVMTRNTAELAANIQATLFNVIRDCVFEGYQESGWKAAADMLAGGHSKKPVVIIGADQTLVRWLQITADPRLIGGGFEDVVIVDTLNDKMKGKIFVAFGVKEAVDGQPHPLQFGNMAFKPEATVVLPITRNGATTKELVVQPAFLHVVNTPFLIEIDVTGIPDSVLNRTPVVVNPTP